ncbi:MAG: leucine-rich repeat domain-containing protein, partial [Ruminococcus sp.]|nr:leucine-rich repeat domain-containing protein [Ruminococcus sp.]
LAFFPADPYAEEPQTEYTVPDGVETIASYAFAESGLTNVILPSSLKKIDAYAFAYTNIENMAIPEGVTVDPAAFGDPGQEDNTPEDSGEGEAPLEIGSVAGEKNLFREEDYAGYKQIANDNFDAWCEQYLAYNQSRGITLNTDSIPYIIRYKGEVIPHYIPMTAVQNRDPAMWTEAASAFGDDFEPLYLMMNHGLFTELARGKMEEPLILYSGLYDSQLMAAAGTDVLPTQQQLVDAIGSTFTDPIMISTTTDPGIAAGFGDTLFIIYASPETMDDLGAVCIDAVVHSQEKEILMNHNARYRILDVGNIAIQHQEPWEDEPTTLYRHYVKVELLK